MNAMSALPTTPPHAPVSATPAPPAWRALLRHETVLALLLVLALAVLASQSDRFFTLDNLLNQGRLMTEVSLVALAMTFVIITGGIDLSVGSIFGLTAILLGVFWQKLGIPLPLAMVLALVVGVLAGLVNGLIITRFGVPPLIATLATLLLYRGLAEGISQGRSVRGYPEWFLDLAQSEWLGVPNQLWVLWAAALVAGVVLGATTWGRATYAIGANETAARFSGIATDRTKLLIYSASGLMASLAAVIFVSRVSTTRSDMGTGLELDVITAVVLGGTSIFGGRGTIVGTVLGLMVMQALKNGLSLAGVKGDGTIIVIGLILIGAIFISNIFNRDGEG
jgi:rhamnose transport system permease protein